MGIDIAIKNGKVASPEGAYSAGIDIKGEKIVALADDEFPQAGKVIDAVAEMLRVGIVLPSGRMDTSIQC